MDLYDAHMDAIQMLKRLLVDVEAVRDANMLWG